ncbi:MAG: hypothetical protein J6D02_07130 [Lachnospira sp.]|nr:hypothetical protein [Lachnospira sp.]
MKVTCRCCRKRFDYNEYKGQCPKCASYYKWKEETQEDMQTGTKVVYSDTKPDMYWDEQTDTSAAKKESSPKHSKSYYIFTVVLILAILLIGAVPLSNAYFTNQRNFDEMAEASVVTPKELKVGEAFDYTIQDYNYGTREEGMLTYQIEITGVHYDTDSRLMVPEGYEMVVAEYEVTAPYDDSEVPGMEDSASDFLYGIAITPYLITKGEEYICPFDELEIQNMKGEERAPFATEDFHQKRGELYFLVKQGDTAGLWLNCMEPGDDIDKLRESYVIRDMEVK